MSNLVLTLLILLSLSFSELSLSFFVKTAYRSNYALRIKSSNRDLSLESTVWNQQVQYVDLNSVPADSGGEIRELPLFLLSYPFFPEGSTNLNIFEMKYRTMMFDVAQKDDCFGYIQVDERSGQIASVGTLCKISSRDLLEDGRQLIALDGVERFRVRKILTTLPYMLAEVEIIQDDTPAETDDTATLEKSVYNLLKFYIRLMKTYRQSKNVVVSQGVKRNRPTLINRNDKQRQSKFSLSLGNMIQMGGKESQLLLQTTSLTQRLQSLKLVMSNVAEYAAQGLIEEKLITAEMRDEIREKAYNDDYDEDILPFEEVREDMDTDKDEWDISNIE
mmetsp:Transcript_37279/g.37959  ORF Transcript_37279/g.37959 Transcript_37279/m.37959 type:complete len:333 (+) Transcript_37279:135-1133(+)